MCVSAHVLGAWQARSLFKMMTSIVKNDVLGSLQDVELP